MTQTAYYGGIEAARAAVDPLILYEEQVTSRQLVPFVPEGPRDREFAASRNAAILKTWRGVPILREQDPSVVREQLTTIKEMENKHALDGERMFIIVFGMLTFVLAGIFLFCVKSMFF